MQIRRQCFKNLFTSDVFSSHSGLSEIRNSLSILNGHVAFTQCCCFDSEGFMLLICSYRCLSCVKPVILNLATLTLSIHSVHTSELQSRYFAIIIMIVIKVPVALYSLP